MADSTRWTVALVIAAVGLGAALYGPTLGLPLFIDDVANFRWLEEHDLDIWVTAQFFPYYRPVPFTVFKGLRALQGGYDALTLHALVVAMHAINALLVGLLARRLTRRPWIGPVAAALFVAFPFSYQTVALVGSFFHLVLLAGLLSAALLALEYVARPRRWILLAAWIAAFLGTFSHENGVLIAPLTGLLLWAEAGSLRALWARRGRVILLLGPMAALAVIYFLAWVLVPKASDATGLITAGVDVKIAYFGQGVVYPLSAGARLFVEADSAAVDRVLLLAALGLGAALIALWGAARGGARPESQWTLARLALLWLAVSAGPSILLLDNTYVIGGPRLLYLATVGITLFWSAWLAELAQHRIGRWLGGGVIALFLAVGAYFTTWRVDDYRRTGDYYDALIAMVQDAPDTSTLVVNAPIYIAPDEPVFLLGAEGALYLPDYVPLRGLVWVNTGHDYPLETVAFPETLAGLSDRLYYPRGPWVGWDTLDEPIQAAGRVISTRFAGRDFRPLHAGDRVRKRQQDDVLARVTRLADYDGLTLYAAPADGSPADSASHAPDRVTLYWRADANPPFATVFVHALCEGQLVAQADGAPVGGLRPFDRWRAGEMWADHRVWGAVPCGDAVTVNVGLYDPLTGERLPAALPDGTTADSIAVR